MTRHHIGGDDFQHSIDRVQEAEDLDAWRLRVFDEHCAAENAKAEHPSHFDEFGALNQFGEVES